MSYGKENNRTGSYRQRRSPSRRAKEDDCPSTIGRRKPDETLMDGGVWGNGAVQATDLYGL